MLRNHLIPDFANDIARQAVPDQGDLQLAWVGTGGLERRPAGIYETGLFCERCENLFSTFEQDVAPFVRNAPGGWDRAAETDESGVGLWRVTQAIYKSLKLFVWSVAYRLHVATRPEGGGVRLPDEVAEEFAHRLQKGDAGDRALYAVTVARYLPSQEMPGIECGIRLMGIVKQGEDNMFQFDLGGFAFMVCVSPRLSVDHRVLEGAIGPDAPCPVSEHPYDGSASDRATRRWVERNKEFIHPGRAS